MENAIAIHPPVSHRIHLPDPRNGLGAVAGRHPEPHRADLDWHRRAGGDRSWNHAVGLVRKADDDRRAGEEVNQTPRRSTGAPAGAEWGSPGPASEGEWGPRGQSPRIYSGRLAVGPCGLPTH